MADGIKILDNTRTIGWCGYRDKHGGNQECSGDNNDDGNNSVIMLLILLLLLVIIILIMRIIIMYALCVIVHVRVLVRVYVSGSACLHVRTCACIKCPEAGVGHHPEQQWHWELYSVSNRIALLPRPPRALN